MLIGQNMRFNQLQNRRIEQLDLGMNAASAPRSPVSIADVTVPDELLRLRAKGRLAVARGATIAASNQPTQQAGYMVTRGFAAAFAT